MAPADGNRPPQMTTCRGFR